MIWSRLRMELILLGMHLIGRRFLNIGLAPARDGDPQAEVYQTALDFAARGAPLSGKCLEVFAGLGRGGALLSAAADWQVAATDICFVGATFSQLRGERFTRSPVEALPFTDDSFDHAIAVEGVVCLPDPAPGLAEIGRVLKPGAPLTIAEFRLGTIAEARNDLTRAATAAGMVVDAFEDITGRARESIVDQWPARARAMRFTPWPLRRPMAELLCLPGTARFSQWEKGERCYYLARLVRA